MDDVFCFSFNHCFITALLLVRCLGVLPAVNLYFIFCSKMINLLFLLLCTLFYTKRQDQ